nr:hypothetical protein [Candidatus Gracilibacteria bacterium]
MIDFNKIVNKLSKKGGKIIFKEDIFEIIDPEKKSDYQNYLDKTIYKLKASGVIISLKSGVYIIPDNEDLKLNEVDLLEKYYLKLLKKYITFYVGSDYFISGNKALEIHLKDYSVANKVYVINRTLDKKVKIGDYEIIFKTVYTTENGKKLNLFSRFYKFVDTKQVEDIEIKIANLELALLQSALVSDSYEGIDVTLLTKTIKKYSKYLKYETFEELARFKFIMSFNRLKEISKTIDKSLYEVFLDIIKKNGGLFIGEGLRKF